MKRLQSMWQKLMSNTYTRVASYVVVAVVFGTIGTLLLTSSHATTPNSSQEGESGSLSGCVSQLSDTTGSNSQVIKFGSSSSGGTGTTDPTNLDTCGRSVPDTAYLVGTCDVTTSCANSLATSTAVFMSASGSDTNAGTKAAPVKTLNKAISLSTSGGTIVIRGGTYRDWYNSSGTTYGFLSKSLTFQAYPHEQVWFDGADVEPTGNWTSNGSGQWSMTWSTPSFCGGKYYDFAYNNQSSPTNTTSSSGTTYGTNNGPCAYYDTYGDPNNPAAADPQMIFKDGTYVHEDVCPSDITTLSTSNFCYKEDLTNKTGTLYLGFNPSGHTIEAAARPMALQVGVSNVTVRGIGFKRFATNNFSNVTQGVIYGGGDNMTIENDVFSQMAGEGIGGSGHNSQVVHSVFYADGYRGVSWNGHQHSDGSTDNFQILSSIFNGNNAEIFDPGCSASCGAAAIKLAHMDGYTFKNNIVENTKGGTKGGVAFWCDLACSNGIMVNNLVHDNNSDGIFYEVSDTGIIASNLVYNNNGYGIRVGSANTKVYNNTVVNNVGFGGLWVYDDSRSFGINSWTDVGPDTVNITVANNIIADTKNSNTILRTQGGSTTIASNTQPSQFFSLFDYNAYWRTSSTQNLMRWIPYGASEIDYKSLATWQTANSNAGYDTHGTEQSAGSDPFFTNLTGGDYTVRTNSTAYHSGTAIPSDVMSALGLSTGTGYSEGAITWAGQ